MQGNLQVASVYASSNCVQLKGPEVIEELYSLLRLLTLCMYFSKKPFPVFLEAAGLSPDDVLLQKPKAGVSLYYFFVLLKSHAYSSATIIKGNTIWYQKAFSQHLLQKRFIFYSVIQCDSI